jgi:Glutamate racemase
MAVGIFDSGLGGLTVWQAVQARLPEVDFTYIADSAHAPYGVRTSDDIYNLTTAAVQRLFDAGCDLVVLACNTASAAALRRMQESWVPTDKRVLGVFVPMIEALTERQWGDNSPPREVALNHVALLPRPQPSPAAPFSVNCRSAPSASTWRRRPAAAWSMPSKRVISSWQRRWCAAMWMP